MVSKKNRILFPVSTCRARRSHSFSLNSMSKRALLDSPLKNRFIGTVLAGKPVASAARVYGIKPQTAHDLFHKYMQTGTTHRRAGSGRPKRISSRLERRVRYLTLRDRHMSFRDIGKLVDPPISADSVRRIMAKAGYHRRKARTVFYLTAVHRARRLSWAREHAKWKEFEWSRIIWSDEAYVVVGDSAGQVFVTRRAGEEFSDDCVVQKFKQSSFRVMIWGCIMQGRKGPMACLEYPGGPGGGMTAARYRQQVLEPLLLEFYQEMSEERGLVAFQQDGAGCHRAGVTRKWLKDHLIDVFPHPASSPDMSPIEAVWHVLKEKIRKRPRSPTTQEELKQAVYEAWDEITEEEIDKYVQSMQNRVQDLINAKGGHTKY